ncbi:lipopolysaccharide heptosyltransferase II [Geoalkalibacter subterraneus]|uniref:lipopolysaccharide heptosyltransferase II n=1 Tax=Geoalkalibacter subterraneus TaxID=483547 RepID=UPI000A87FF5C
MLKKIDPASINKIMVRMTNWVGDAVMTTPALSQVRATFPDAEIVVVANPLVAELFQYHPDCDRVLVFDKKSEHQGLGGFIKFCAQLRRERFDLAILFQNAIEAAFMAAWALIPRRAGYKTDGRGWLLNYGVPAADRKHGLHHTEYYLRMVREIGLSGGDDCLKLALTDDEKQWASQQFSGHPWVAVNPGAAYGSAKRWIPERFAAVADSLAEKHQVQIVLTGGPGEREIGADIENSMHSRPLNLIGQTSVRQMMAVLDRCRLMVTNDSGPMHVAAAFGVPIVAVFGPTDHRTTSPHAQSCRIIRSDADCAPCMLRQCPTDHRCMEAVTVNDVLTAADELLGARS